MGTLQLHCPLCCTETFSCHNSLKYHLLSISDNLICPACGQRFERIFDLAMHLGNQCDDGLVNEKPEHVDKTPMERYSPICVKIEDVDVEETVTSSILARALTKDMSAVQQQNDEEVSENEDLYMCSTCDIQFNSIEDHIREFHDGHDVYLQNEGIVESDNSDVLIVCTENGKDEEEETMVIPDHIHKSGLSYTPKLVKIERFWSGRSDEGDAQAAENAAESDADDSLIEIYECVRCSLTFRTEEYFNKHKCKSSNFGMRKCSACDASFTSVKLLNAHMKTHASLCENPNPPFVCEVCNTEFPLFKSLRLHRRMHEPIKSKSIEPPVNYSLEGEQVEDISREKFVCPICSKEYDKEYAEAHKKFHSQEKDYNCEICNRKFFSQENLDMHMHAHAEVKKFTCSYCKKAFLTSDKLEAHMSAQCQMRQYECQYCGRRFSRPHEKVKHERIHTGEKPHKCEICGKAFRVSYCLTLHMRTHSGIRPYKCDQCGKRFKAHSVYNHHLLTHSDDRKYKCPFCPKSFKTGVQLAGHKNSHTKPFTCTECNRPFASLYAVRSHMATHKRQNNLKFKCWLCGASYARSFALRDHIKEQHHEHAKEVENLSTVEFAIRDTIDTGDSILTDGDECMLIDMPGGEDVNSIEISGVAMTLSDNN